ncbi:MAG TPA: hypothetical protein GXZ85_11005, partial [Firmicutes bacterium]|nr:hypothetical protein [Bacillota bacterium]
MSDIIVQVVTRMMIPYLQLYGLYIILYGHNSPGGGFAGGTIIASSLILYVLAFGLKMSIVCENVTKMVQFYSVKMSPWCFFGGV